jgi:hypothetical protein
MHECLRHCRGARGVDCGAIVRLSHLVSNILDVADSSRAVHDEDCPLQEAPFFDQCAVGAAEILVFVG